MAKRGNNRAFTILIVSVIALILVGLLVNAQRPAGSASDSLAANTRVTSRQSPGDASSQLADSNSNPANPEAERDGVHERASDTARPKRRDPQEYLDHPEFQKSVAADVRNSLGRSHGRLFRMLTLNPGELEKLKDLLTERHMSAMDVMRAAQMQGVPVGVHRGEIANLIGKEHQAIDERIHGFLGDQGFSQYQFFNQNFGSYQLLDEIERRVTQTSTPLNAAESEATLRVLIETSQRPGGDPTTAFMVQAFGGSNNDLRLSVETQPVVTDETIEIAQAVLSAPLVEALKQLQARQKEQREVLAAMRRFNTRGRENE